MVRVRNYKKRDGTKVQRHTRKDPEHDLKYSSADYKDFSPKSHGSSNSKQSESFSGMIKNRSRKYIRIAALGHKRGVKVLFVRGGRTPTGKYYSEDFKSYFMPKHVYDSIPLNVDATPSDYRKYGRITEATNNDLRDDEKRHTYYLGVTDNDGNVYAYPMETQSEAQKATRLYDDEPEATAKVYTFGDGGVTKWQAQQEITANKQRSDGIISPDKLKGLVHKKYRKDNMTSAYQDRIIRIFEKIENGDLTNIEEVDQYYNSLKPIKETTTRRVDKPLTESELQNLRDD